MFSFINVKKKTVFLVSVGTDCLACFWNTLFQRPSLKAALGSKRLPGKRWGGGGGSVATATVVVGANQKATDWSRNVTKHRVRLHDWSAHFSHGVGEAAPSPHCGAQMCTGLKTYINVHICKWPQGAKVTSRNVAPFKRHYTQITSPRNWCGHNAVEDGFGCSTMRLFDASAKTV